MKKIVVITPTDPTDKFGHSGVVYSICSQISKENKIIWLKPKVSIVGILCNLIPLLYVYILKALGYTISHHPAISKMYSYYLSNALKKMDYDCILGFESLYLSYLKTDKPILYRTDGVYHSMVNYYIKNIPHCMIKQGDIVEECALMKSTYVLFPSQWVYDETRKYYVRVNSDKLKVIESGANIPYVNEKIKKVKHDILNLLFVGSDPVRKGVDVAIDCVRSLNENYHIKACLTIIGGNFVFTEKTYINYVGRINKNNLSDAERFRNYFKNADFLLFPTKAECAGIVSCEAAAYGVPVLAYNTGGVSSYVIDGRNGHIFDLSATGDDFADFIHHLSDTAKDKMSVEARLLYETKFNWDVWGRKVNELIREL